MKVIRKVKNKSFDNKDKGSAEESHTHTIKREKPEWKATYKSTRSAIPVTVRKAYSSTRKNQNNSQKESESEDISDDEPLI